MKMTKVKLFFIKYFIAFLLTTLCLWISTLLVSWAGISFFWRAVICGVAFAFALCIVEEIIDDIRQKGCLKKIK